MTISIHIEVHPDRGDMGVQVERAMSALGYVREGAVLKALHTSLTTARSNDQVDWKPVDDAEAVYREKPVDPAVMDAVGEKIAETQRAATEPVVRNEERPLDEEVAEVKQTLAAANTDRRPVGAPAEGNKRRSSAEKAEDDEFEKLAVEKNISVEKLNVGIAAVGRAEAKAQLEALEAADKIIEPQAAISTGENRVGPEDEQDAADEAAETEKSGLAPIDVLRRLLGDYQKANGMPAAVKLCQEGGLIGAPIHELDEAGIEKAIAALSASPLSPVTRASIAGGKPVEKVAPKTKADLIEAMMRYADKFDGTREQKDMKFTLIDCPAIFVDVFGSEVTKLSLVPENGYGKAVAAIEQAIASDPFGRAK